jgi:hypothetical protein
MRSTDKAEAEAPKPCPCCPVCNAKKGVTRTTKIGEQPKRKFFRAEE